MYKQPRGERVSYRSNRINLTGPSASRNEGNNSTSKNVLKYIDYNSHDAESPLPIVPYQHSVQSSSAASSLTDNDLYACTPRVSFSIIGETLSKSRRPVHEALDWRIRSEGSLRRAQRKREGVDLIGVLLLSASDTLAKCPNVII